ncbi:MAG: hypothetical protein GW870_03855 [Deltaproteobacteria bacterium]|nr:hypothetical protein [Deltaproteobacteria bacterium]NCP97172.1 hypothetical protein [Deltaproteobacteria bacterium]PJB97307.1 MAG: hypothetical protein CO080_00590 [Nitrospirae bacterium CG_4_9_14_0_8_um_filter_70_14]
MAPFPHLLAAPLAGAAVILAGGAYALCFALGRVRGGGWRMAALACYGLLAAAVVTLAWALDLRGFWRGVAGLMVAGYFVGPRLISRLSRDLDTP